MKTPLLILALSLSSLFTVAQTASETTEKDPRIIISAQGSDVAYRLSRTRVHVKDYDYEEYRHLKSGADILEMLSKEGPIRMWIHYSHGRTDRLFGKDLGKKWAYFSSGIITAESHNPAFSESRMLDDLRNKIASGEIQFAPKSIIYLGACAVGETDPLTGQIFAQELANITGATVIAGVHQTEPLIENYKEMVFTNKDKFLEFKAYQSPKDIGNKIQLDEVIRNFLSTYTDTVDFETPTEYQEGTENVKMLSIEETMRKYGQK